MKAMMETNERAFKTALDIVVKQMNDQINKLEGKVSDLTTSLEFSQREVEDLKANTKEYEKEKKEDRMKLEKLKEHFEASNVKIKQLEDRLNYQEDMSRRKHIRFSGIEEREGGERCEQVAVTVTSLLEEKLQLAGITLERAHCVCVRRDAKPRPIVARFTR